MHKTKHKTQEKKTQNTRIKNSKHKNKKHKTQGNTHAHRLLSMPDGDRDGEFARPVRQSNTSTPR
jgi:hypothetical protein